VAGVPEHFNMPWLLGLERRAFARAGVEVKWRTVPQGTGAMCEMLHRGEIDLAVMVTEGAVGDILKGGANRIVAPFVDSPITWGVHVGAWTGIHDPAGLEGLPILISRPNSGSHLAALCYAHWQGWSVGANDLEVVQDLGGALDRLNRPGPAVFLWERFTTRPYVLDGRLRQVDAYKAEWPSFLLVATEAVLADHPAGIIRLLKVLRDQASGLMAKRTAPELIAKRYDLSLGDAQAWFTDVRWNTGTPLTEATLRRVVDALVASGTLGPVPTGSSLLDRLVWTPADR
jgi:ABC-type nitrate/sulfonate/bicarbonate transport system substrate-binding protein